jgi:hypothetical protein
VLRKYGVEVTYRKKEAELPSEYVKWRKERDLEKELKPPELEHHGVTIEKRDSVWVIKGNVIYGNTSTGIRVISSEEDTIYVEWDYDYPRMFFN